MAQPETQGITQEVHVELPTAPTTKDSKPETRKTRTRRRNNGLTGGGKVALGLVIPAMIIGGGLGGYALYKHENTDKSNATIESEQATPTPSQAGEGTEDNESFFDRFFSGITEKTTPTSTETGSALSETVENEGEVIAQAIPVPTVISGDMARELKIGGVNPMFKEGEWFNPVYDLTQETAEDDYRGIGPWYPVAFRNLDADAAVLTSHGNVGELIVSGRNGGMVMVSFMQLDAHQHEGAWGTDETNRLMQDTEWAMQYNFRDLAPLQELFVVDPDTGQLYLWPDGSPVIYRANDRGIAAFAIPATNGQDVRVAFVFRMPSQGDGVQVPEVKIERGPNDRPGLTGENPLPDSVLKPMIAER